MQDDRPHGPIRTSSPAGLPILVILGAVAAIIYGFATSGGNLIDFGLYGAILGAVLWGLLYGLGSYRS